jgi:hypothetical protein
MEHAVILHAGAPTTIGFWFWSERITAPHQMLASSPMVTSPMITAVGATNALGEIFGFLPLYSIIMRSASGYLAHDMGRP